MVAHVRRRAHLDNTDALGNVKDAGRIATVEAFLEEYTPKGGISALGEGQTLATHTRALQAGLYRHGFAAQADALGPLLAAFDAALRRVETETVELSAAYRKLEEARTEADTARLAARAYTLFAAAWSPDLGIDVTAAFPVTRVSTAANPLIDAAGADPAPSASGDTGAPTPRATELTSDGASSDQPSE